jgi:hypothetical protein
VSKESDKRSTIPGEYFVDTSVKAKKCFGVPSSSYQSWMTAPMSSHRAHS